jgi:hypothetical protein
MDKLAPRDLRRTCARLCHAAGGELSKSTFCSVRFQFRQPNDTSAASSGAVNGKIGIEPPDEANRSLSALPTNCLKSSNWLVDFEINYAARTLVP